VTGISFSLDPLATYLSAVLGAAGAEGAGTAQQCPGPGVCVQAPAPCQLETHLTFPA